MMRDGRFLEGKQCRQFLHIALAIGDETDQLETAFIAQRLEVPEESGGVVIRHLFSDI
jgi:hypothetical protein